MALVYLSLAWIAGILLGSRFDVPLAFVFAGLAPLPLLFIIRRHRKLIVLASLCLVVFVTGAVYFQSRLPVVDEGSLQFYDDRGAVEIKGMVSGAPEVGDKTTRLRLVASELKAGEGWRDVSGTAMLFVARYPAYGYGDVLLVKGKLETPPQLDDFDYRGYLARQEIYATMLYPRIEVLDRGKGSAPLRWVYSVRSRLSQTLAEVLPEPQASLAQGILLGIRTNIPDSVNADFVSTGTAHILAISGHNLSIVAGILVSLGLLVFGRRHYLYVWLALGAIWLYALLTGMQPPVVRAAIMASVFLFAELLGRQRTAITALAFAVAVMVGASPQVLWDASFQLSFMAMAGLIIVAPPVQSLLRRGVKATLGEEGMGVSVANFVADSLSVTLGALIAVWPIIAYYFGIVSFAAPLANLFAVPAMAAIIMTGALAGSLGLIFLPIGQAVGWLAWLFLSYMLLVMKVFAIIPPLKTGPVDGSLIWLYYSAVALVIWTAKNRQKLVDIMSKVVDFVFGLPKKWVLPPLAVAAVLVWVSAVTMPDSRLHVSFLDVGQGDAILIQKGTQQILVDGGPSPQAIAIGLSQEMPFWDRTIDLVVSTHPHADHSTGLIEVLNRYKVKLVLYPDLKYESPANEEWQMLIEGKKIKSTLAQAGQRISLGREVVIEVLNPSQTPLAGTESDIDNNSVVLRVGMGEVSFLFTADVMREAELELITRRANLSSTVLKVAHHGSATSTSDEFLAVVSPQVAVITVGQDNPFGHPTAEVMDRLQQKLGQQNIYRTDKNAKIEFITDGTRLWVEKGK